MPTTPDRGLVRLLRGGIVGLVAVVAAIGLHSWSQGPGASPSLALLVLPPAVIIGAALANRRYDFWRAFGVLIALQPLMHLVALSTSHVDHSPAATPSGTFDDQMLLAHVIAAAVGAWWVAIGDRVLWQWVGNIGVRYTALAVPAISMRERSPFPATSVKGHPTANLLTTAPRRGPPVAARRLSWCA